MNSQDSIRQYYEEYYGTKRDQVTGQSLRRVRSNFRGINIKPDTRFIDVGCGLGAVGSYLAGQGVMPVGIDISLEAIRVASGAEDYVALVQANAEKLPFSNASFGGAAFMGTLEHFRNPSGALKEIIRILKPEAQICFVVPNSDFFLFKFLKGTGQPHEVPRKCGGWRMLFETAGLKIDSIYRDIGPDVFEGGLLKGVLRKLILFAFNLLPICHTYQFVFICRR